jgi:hypothetical protein
VSRLRRAAGRHQNPRVTAVQPSGTVTLVFTDIEGSTRLLEEIGVDAYRRGPLRAISGFEELWQRGRSLPVEEAIALGLQQP